MYFIFKRSNQTVHMDQTKLSLHCHSNLSTDSCKNLENVSSLSLSFRACTLVNETLVYIENALRKSHNCVVNSSWAFCSKADRESSSEQSQNKRKIWTDSLDFQAFCLSSAVECRARGSVPAKNKTSFSLPETCSVWK